MLNGDILKKSEAIDIDESPIHLEFKTPKKKNINMNKSHSLDHWQEKLEQYIFLKPRYGSNQEFENKEIDFVL